MDSIGFLRFGLAASDAEAGYVVAVAPEEVLCL